MEEAQSANSTARSVRLSMVCDFPILAGVGEIVLRRASDAQADPLPPPSMRYRSGSH